MNNHIWSTQSYPIVRLFLLLTEILGTNARKDEDMLQMPAGKTMEQLRS